MEEAVLVDFQLAAVVADAIHKVVVVRLCLACRIVIGNALVVVAVAMLASAGEYLAVCLVQYG